MNLDEVWVKIQVLEKDVQRLSLGQRVELSLPDSTAPVVTKIDRIDVALDPQGQVCWAWATVPGSTAMPGLVGSATIVISEAPNRLSVPRTSVYSDGLQSYVFVEEASTKSSSEYRKRDVKLGRRASSLSTPNSDPNVEVLQGDVYRVIESSSGVVTSCLASFSWGFSNSTPQTENALYF